MVTNKVTPSGSSHKLGQSQLAEDDDDDDVDMNKASTSKRQSSHASINPNQGLRAILPQIINEQNRKTLGTWQRQLDFTRTIIGYLLGIHNFFRFPYLCYKFGGIFFIPYVIMMLFVGVPVVFMEFTIGQYYGVGSYVAFTHMSPILSGVSKLLTWSSIINCWMYTVILAWCRIYSNDATSCLKGWEVCEDRHYYNTPHCYTGVLDDECNDPTLVDHFSLNITQLMEGDMIFYNYKCRTVDYYCESHGWTKVPNGRMCQDSNGTKHSIYERRYHATEEFFYGAVLGFQRQMELIRDDVLIEVVLNVTGHKTVVEIVKEIYPDDGNMRKINEIIAEENPIEIIRTYLTYLKDSDDDAKNEKHKKVKDAHMTKKYQEKYWTKEGQQLAEDPASSSYKELQQLSMTTWIMIAVFLFEDLLKISFLSYILNAVPFVILIYVTTIAVLFAHSGHGIENIFTLKEGFFADLSHLDIWSEAVIQVIYTTGIGNGVLISLATFNNINHNYIVDLYCTLCLAIITSCCGVLITFCSLGQYIKQYNIDVPFREYIRAESVSSVEFSLICNSIFLTLISNQNVTIILLFFMITSFATDTAIRLVQSVLDTVMNVSARFKHHSTMVLVAVCLMGYLMLVPVFKNGAFVLFVDFEYFSLRYVMPTIVLIQIGACVFVYRSNRLVDHSEQMGVFYSYSFRLYMIICMYLSFIFVLLTIIINVFEHQTQRFNGVYVEVFDETFGWAFFMSPMIMVILSVIKQFIVVPRTRWGWLFMPLKGKDRKVRRAFLRRIQGGGQNAGQKTDHENIRDAALQWRKLESKLLLAMMAKRKEEREQQERARDKREEKINKAVAATPLLVSLVKLAAAAKKEDEELFGGNLGNDGDGVTGGMNSGGKLMHMDDDDKCSEMMGPAQKGKRRLGFIHVTAGNCMAKWKAAFMGKVTRSGKCFRPKRHIGGQGSARIITRLSEDGTRVTNLEEEDDQESESSISINNDEDVEERARMKYLDGMDYIERWPGRLDESEIESEGSSLGDSDEGIDDI